jgi:hypothetical protein
MTRLAGATSANLHSPFTRRTGALTEHTQEPKNDEDNDHKAEDAAEATGAIAVVTIVTPAAAEHQQQDNDNQNCTHGRYLSILPIGEE